MDPVGFSGLVEGTDLMTGDQATVGGWPFNINLISLSFKDNELISSNFRGRCKLPIADNDAWLRYDGRLNATVDTVTNLPGWEMVLGVAADPVPIDLFRAAFSFDERSTITIPYANGTFGYPSCNLNGFISFDIPEHDAGFDPVILGLIDDLDEVLGPLGVGDLSPRMDLEGLAFSNMSFDWGANPKFSFGSIVPQGLDLSFLSIDADLKEIAWRQIGTDAGGQPKFGFDFDIQFPSLGPFAPKVDFSIGYRTNPAAGPQNPGASIFEFDGFKFNFGLPELEVPEFDFSCGDEVPEITITSSAGRPSLEGLDELRVGFFKMTDLGNISAGATANSFNGQGKINVPAFGPFGDLSVRMENVVVNDAGQIVGGRVMTLTDEALNGSPEGASAAELLAAVEDKKSKLIQNIEELFTLPVVLGVQANGENSRDQGLIITGVEFGPEGATVDAKVVIPLGSGQHAQFEARDLGLVPNGIAGGELRVGLTGEFALPIPGDQPLMISPYNGTTGSYVAMDCGGFVEFKLQGYYPLSEDDYVASDGSGAVTLGFEISTQEWGEFVGTFDGSVPFNVVGIPDFSFALGTGQLDFSRRRNPTGLEFPEGYAGRGPAWQGFFAPEMTVSLPPMFSRGGEPTIFTATNVLMDSTGISSDIVARNLLDLSSGSLGNWGFSIDSFAVSLRENKLVNGLFEGGMQLPIMADDEALPYSTSFAPAPAPDNYTFNFKAKPDTVSIGLLRSTFLFDSTSTITVGYENGAFQTPVADLSGMLKFGAKDTDQGFSAEFNETVADLEANFPDMGQLIPTFRMEGIAFSHFRFDPYATKRFSVEGLEARNTSISFLGQTADLNGVDFAEMDLSAEAIAQGVNATARMMSFDFETTVAEEYLGALAPRVTMSMQITEDVLPGGGVNYDFFKFNIDYAFDGLAKLNVDCRNQQSEITFSEVNYPSAFTAESLDAGYFTIDELSISEDNGNGLISGTGRVTVPVLGPMARLDVRFEGIQLDENGRLREGDIITESEIDDTSNPPSPDTFFSRARAKLDAVADAFKLPIIMGSETGGFTIVGLRLQPDRASVQAKVIVPTGESSYVEFVGDALTLVPNGIASAEGRLYLGNDVSLEGLTGLPLTIRGGTGVDTASYATCDCDGFQSFKLQGVYEFDKLLNNIERPGEPVIARMNMESTAWGDFTGQIEAIDVFGIDNAKGFSFQVEEGLFDFSTRRRLVSLSPPPGQEAPAPEWQGIYLPRVSITMPMIFNQGEAPSRFTAENIIVDKEGLTGRLEARNVIDLSTGSMGGWGYSLDSIRVDLVRNDVVDNVFGGGIQLPIMQGEEYLPYDGKMDWNETTKTLDVDFTARPDTASIEMLRSSFSFDPSSIITVGVANGEFQTPKVNLSGLFSVDFGGDGSNVSGKVTDFLNDIADYFTSFDIPDLGFSFNSEGIRFENFVFDMEAENKFSVGNITPQQTNISFLGQTADLSGIDLKTVDVISELQMLKNELDQSAKNLSFSFETKLLTEFLGGLAPTVKMDLVIEENEQGLAGLPSYAYKGINLSWTAPELNFSCASNLEPLEISEVPYSGSFNKDEQIRVGRFVMSDLDLTANSNGVLSGTGTIDVPVLGPMRYLDVAFSNVKLNTEGQIYEGEVVTQSDMSNAAETEDMGILMNTALNKLSNFANELVKLPIVLGDTSSAAFTIVGLTFGPTEAALQTRLLVNTGNRRFLEFTAEGLEIVPNGIADVSARLGLARAYTLPGLDGVLPVTFTPYDRVKEEGTYASCDCEGFQVLNLNGELEFSRNYVLSRTKENEEGEPATVTAEFRATAEGWEDILGNIMVNDSIYLVGAKETPFYLGEALIDLSNKQDHEGIAWPEGYADIAGTSGSWEGVYIANATMPLPRVLAENTKEEPGSLGVKNLVMDANGFTGSFRGLDLLDMETTSLYGFGMALDSFEIRFQANTLLIGELFGRFNLPLFEAGEGIPFRSFVTPGGANQDYMNFTWLASPGKVSVPSLSAQFNFNDQSEIVISRTATGFSYPKFDLSGTIEVTSNGTGLGNEFDAFINDVNDATGTEILPDLDIDSINFEHFVFDLENEDGYFSIGDVTANKSDITFLGRSVELDEINFDELVALGMNPDSALAAAEGALRQLGFRLDLTVDLPVLGEMPIGFTLKLNEFEELVNGVRSINYDFGGVKLDYDFPDLAIPDFSCESPPPPEAPADQSAVALTKNTKVDVNGFSLRITELNGSGGKGRIRIPFMNYTMNVSFRDLEVNAAGQMLGGEILTDVESSLVPDDAISTEEPDIPVLEVSAALTSFLEKTQEFFTLPISLADKLQETAGLELPEGFDIILLGVVWTPEGAKMNMALTVPSIVEGGDPLQFGVRGLNIRTDGIDMGDLKIFLAETIKF